MLSFVVFIFSDCPDDLYWVMIAFFFLRPLLKLVDKLLLVGVLQDEDITRLLIMIDPQTWDAEFDPGESEKCKLKN